MEPSQMEDVLAYVDREACAAEDAARAHLDREIAALRHDLLDLMNRLTEDLDARFYSIEGRITDLEDRRHVL
jgi:hypothetical protein